MQNLISIIFVLFTLPLFSQNLSDTTKILKQPDEKKERMPMIHGDETVDPNMPMFPKSDYVKVDVPPVPVKEVQPKFPNITRRLDVTVWVKVLVSIDGKVKKAKVIKSDHEILNQAALDAARQWLFKPAMLNNKPVEAWTGIQIRFKVNTK